MIEVFSVILGQKNLSSRKPILLTTGVTNYFNECLHGDGNLPEELGLYSEESSIFEFNELNKIINNIQEAKSDLQQIETVLSDYKNKIEERKDFKGVEIFDLNDNALTFKSSDSFYINKYFSLIKPVSLFLNN